MRRIAIRLIPALITFTFGITLASLLNWTKCSSRTEEPPLQHSAARSVDQPNETAPIGVPEPSHSDAEIFFAKGRLKIVTEQVQLKSERLRYEIDVRYPQIVGIDSSQIRELNQHIKRLAIEEYQWPLNPSKADLRFYREKWPDVFNSVDLDYRIISANDVFLSIYFCGYSYGIGAAHSVQFSFVVNYDLTLQKRIELSDIFQRRSEYLRFISEYCANEFSKKSRFNIELAARSGDFESWNITNDGIRFNFDACNVLSCAEGEQTIDISFTDLKRFLRPDVLNTLTTQ